MSQQFVAPMRRLTGGRLIAALLVALIATGLVLLICPLIGADMRGAVDLLDPAEVWRGVTGAATPDGQLYLIARLPRALGALVVGAGLAAAGCAFQAVLRNPLAEPYTLGISSGASLAAVIAIRFGIGASLLGVTGVSLAALIGATVAGYTVWRIGRIGRALPPATLILAGITIAMICSAASMLILYTSDLYQISRIVRWMMGGLEMLEYRDVGRTAVLVALGCAALLAIARDLNPLAAGADAAASVGVDPRRTMTVAFAASSLIVGATIALAGPIGAIGLIVPHVMRGLVGPDHRVLVPASMMVGGAGLIACDTVARTVLFPAEIPVGVITAIAGGGFFLYLLVREKRSARLWGG